MITLSLPVDPQSRQSLLNDSPIFKLKNPKEANYEPSYLSDLISFKLEASETTLIKGKKDFYLPIMATVKTDYHEGQNRLGLDLILVIDVSGSMYGERLELAVKTLHFVIDALEPCDRLCLIAFSKTSQILTNLMPVTLENKEIFHEKADYLEDLSSTNIIAGLRDAFDVLASRKQVNDLTAVFLLSDGEDTCGNARESFAPFLTSQNSRVKGDYKIHSFGFGNDHDEDLLCKVSDFKHGNFYYIRDEKSVGECFVACLGTILSSFAKEVKIEIISAEGVEIVKTFGLEWSEPNVRPASINIRSLSYDLEKHYIGRIKIKEVPTNHSEMSLLFGKLLYQINKVPFEKESKLVLKLVESISEQGPVNRMVCDNLLRVQAAELIFAAERDMGEGKKDDAYSKIEDFNKIVAESEANEEKKNQIAQILQKDQLDSKKAMKGYAKQMLAEEFVPNTINLTEMNKLQRRISEKLKKSN